MKMSDLSNPFVEIVQRQLDCYNARDIDGFLATFSENIVLSSLGSSSSTASSDLCGKAALRDKYGALFRDFPSNRCDLKHRIVINNKVIDHERVFRNGGGGEGGGGGGDQCSFEVVACYTIEDGVIARCDFIK